MASSSARSAPPLAIDPRPSFEKHRTAWAFVAGMAVAFSTGALGYRCTATPAEHKFGAQSLMRERVTPISGREILADIAAARAQGSPFELPAPATAQRPVGAAAQDVQAAPAPSAEAHTATRSARTREPAHRMGPSAYRQAAADNAYASLFGDAEQFRAGNRLRPRSGEAAALVDSTGHGEGTLMAARLETEVASAPSGGPVVAVLQRAARIGGQLVPRGAQVHGTCRGTGNSDTRVFIDFDFIRLAGGKSMPIAGMAVDLEGRHGVPGRKMITGRSAGSVGLTAAARAARALGRGLAGSVGGAIGAGIDGAADATGQKAQRLDQDEYVVIAARGTALQIYLKHGAKR